MSAGGAEMKHYPFMVIVLLLLLLFGCRASPTETPTPESPPEPSQELLDSVPFAMPEEGVTEAWRQARRLFFSAYMMQLQGALDEAVRQYQSSINTFPTAEAYTFMGWTYSWMGRYDDAIREAKQAILVDPEYGNPYNDIVYISWRKGSLMKLFPG